MFVILQHILHEKPFATQITHKIPRRAVKAFVQLQIVFIVEHFVALITSKFGANFVLELEMIAASARDRKRFFTQQTHKFTRGRDFFDVRIDFTFFWVFIGNMRVEIFLY